jgi:hypothetical protein
MFLFEDYWKVLSRFAKLRRRFFLSLSLIFISSWLVIGFVASFFIAIVFVIICVVSFKIQAERDRPSMREIELARKAVTLRLEPVAFILLAALLIERVFNLLPDLSRPFFWFASLCLSVVIMARETWLITSKNKAMPWEGKPISDEDSEISWLS